MANAHLLNVRLAAKTGDDLKRLFDRLGNTSHPRGFVTSAYRTLLSSLSAGVIDSPTAALDLFRSTRYGLESGLRSTLADSADLGAEQAAKELDAWGLVVPAYDAEGLPLIRNATETILSAYDQQANAAYTMIESGDIDRAEILGDETRVGLLTVAPVLLAATRWIVTAQAYAQSDRTEQTLERNGQSVSQYGLQAIAAIDDKTTDCCLKVHGQIIPVNGKFHLTGTPRFADDMAAPPFHWNCRTATALVKLDEQDDDLTRILQAAAQTEIEARRDGVQDVPKTTNAGSARPSRVNRLRQIIRN